MTLNSVDPAGTLVTCVCTVGYENTRLRPLRSTLLKLSTRALSRVTWEARTRTFWMLKFDLENEVQLRRQHLAAPQQPHQRWRHKHFLEVTLGQGLGKAADVVDLEALVGLVDPPLARLQQRVQVHGSAVVVDVVCALAVGEKLDSFDQAGGVSHDGVKVVGGVVVDEAESYLDAFGVDKIRARRQGNANNSRGRGRDGAEGAWEILRIFARHHVGCVGRAHLVVQALHELVIDGVRHHLHVCESIVLS